MISLSNQLELQRIYKVLYFHTYLPDSKVSSYKLKPEEWICVHRFTFTPIYYVPDSPSKSNSWFNCQICKYEPVGEKEMKHIKQKEMMTLND